MELWLQALLFGLFSALSLPIGAVLGIYLSPVREEVTAKWMAFGSGALVFAVATQLYGQALDRLLITAERDKEAGQVCGEICRQHCFNIILQNITGILGAVMYLGLNRCLESVARRSAQAPPPASEMEASVVTDETARQTANNFAAGTGPNPTISQQRLLVPRDRSAREMSDNLAAGTGQNLVVPQQPRLMPSDRTVTCPATPLASPITALSAFRRAASINADPFFQGINASPAAASDAEASRSCAAPNGQLSVAEGQHAAHGEVDVSSGNVALSMWLGLLLDGIPESLMLGFMTNEGAITGTFLIAILVANFPEAFSGASLLRTQGMSAMKVFAMWFVVFALTGLLAMLGSIIMPDTVTRGSIEMKVRDTSTAALEGLTGGAMLAMIATAMLPEAFKGAGEYAGIYFVLGFVLSVWISCFGARFGGLQSAG